MSVTIKSKSDIQKLREAGRIAANALVHAGKVIHPGMTTKQLSAPKPPKVYETWHNDWKQSVTGYQQIEVIIITNP
jgi:methionine aminopeptidase